MARKPIKIVRIQDKLNVQFRTPRQEEAWHTIKKHDITFLTGPAGSAKTFLAVAYAIDSLLSGRTERIYLTRPAVEAGERLGFLPGSMDEKLHPFLQPIYDAIDKLSLGDRDTKAAILSATTIRPLAYMRGVTLENSVCVLDEAQNTTQAQLKLYLSRLGLGSKMIVCGDACQSDIGRQCCLLASAEAVQDLVGWVAFQNEDIVRHPIIGQILQRLDKLS